MDIKDKIAKLLALAGNNPSESEAKAALLKARELMAQHKLRPEECQIKKAENIVQSLVGVSFTGRKNAWASNLSAIIAKHYCCLAYRAHRKGAKAYEVGFVGVDDDFEICSRIFRYAFDCVSSTAEQIFREDADIYTARWRRKNAEAYGYAFCRGLQAAFAAQQEEHQEWGLVMVVPQAVKETELGRQTPSGYGNENVVREASANVVRRGYEDGLKFDPSTKLAQGEIKAPLRLGD